MVELKLFLMPPLKRSGRVKAFLENTTRRVEIFQKSRLGLDSSLEGRFHIFAAKTVGFDRFEAQPIIYEKPSTRLVPRVRLNVCLIFQKHIENLFSLVCDIMLACSLW